MSSAYRFGKSLKNLVLVVIVALIIMYHERQIERERVFEPSHDHAQAGQALVRYIQLRRRCPEEVAYQRVAAFVKKHTPPDERPTVDWLLANDRPRLLTLAQNILRQHPDEIDEI